MGEGLEFRFDMLPSRRDEQLIAADWCEDHDRSLDAAALRAEIYGYGYGDGSGDGDGSG